MKNATQWTGIAALFLLLACAGSIARQQVTLPALRSTWVHLRDNGVTREIEAAPNAAASSAVAAANSAMESGDAAAIQAVGWPAIETVLEADVVRCLATGKLGPLGAESRRALVTEFAEARAIYARSKP